MKKPRAVAPKVKPANMSDADWAKELARRAVVTADRQRRRAIQRQQDAEAACFASYVANQGTSTGDSSPVAARSGTDGSMLFSPRLPLPRMSPEFGESQTYLCTVDGGVGVRVLVDDSALVRWSPRRPQRRLHRVQVAGVGARPQNPPVWVPDPKILGGPTGAPKTALPMPCRPPFWEHRWRCSNPRLLNVRAG
jgi:hypothetical protein